MVRSVADIFRSYSVLDENGRHVNGTDKQSNHNYGGAYETLFTVSECVEMGLSKIPLGIHTHSIRADVQMMMEVGVADGSSLLAWSEIFPNATCVGLDIHPASRVFRGLPRIEFHLGDATVKEDCDRAAAGRKFDLIVDDGTHLLEDTLRTLLFLWPHVKRGGLYVIEEFANIGALQDCVLKLFSPMVSIVPTVGPFGGSEPLVVLRKP